MSPDLTDIGCMSQGTWTFESSAASIKDLTVSVDREDAMSLNNTGDGCILHGICAVMSTTATCVEQTMSVNLKYSMSPKPNASANPNLSSQDRVIVSDTSPTHYCVCIQAAVSSFSATRVEQRVSVKIQDAVSRDAAGDG